MEHCVGVGAGLLRWLRGGCTAGSGRSVSGRQRALAWGVTLVFKGEGGRKGVARAGVRQQGY